MAKFAVNEIVVQEAFTIGTLRVVIIAAIVANKDIIAVSVDSKGNVIVRKIFVALRAEKVFIGKSRLSKYSSQCSQRQ